MLVKFVADDIAFPTVSHRAPYFRASLASNI